ncbi:hypothetical protein L6R29_21205 [Myxococcota bacterium]|nr:hypothetical protein [Myxococcota bacterium]
MRRVWLLFGLLWFGQGGCNGDPAPVDTWFCRNDGDCRPIGAFLCERSVCVPFARAQANRENAVIGESTSDEKRETNGEKNNIIESDAGDESPPDLTQPPDGSEEPAQLPDGSKETTQPPEGTELPPSESSNPPDPSLGCRKNEDCFSGFFCNTEAGQSQGECVECLLHTDCKPHEPICYQKRCVPCREDADCTKVGRNPTTPFCDRQASRCVVCLKTADCTAPLACIHRSCSPCLADVDCGSGLFCDQGACVACLRDADCASKRCEKGRCIECKADADCAKDPNDPKICSLSSSRCVACETDQHCQVRDATKPYCIGNLCQVCAKSSHCPQGQACKGGVCASCLIDPDCGADAQCVQGECIQKAVVYTQSPVSARRWSDGSVASSCMGYRYPPSRFYRASTDDGVYAIKPTAADAPSLAYCEMTTQGGGWTLVLKADGRYPTFAYDSPYWLSSQGGLNEDSLDESAKEALFGTYGSIPLSQVMLKMRDANDPVGKVGNLVMGYRGNSLRRLISQERYLPVQREERSSAWLGLLPKATYHTAPSSCLWQGINIATNTYPTSSMVRALRLGIVWSEYGCTSIAGHSFLGVGAQVVPYASSGGGAVVTSGNFATGVPEHEGTAAQVKNKDAVNPGFAWVYVRLLPARALLVQDVDRVYRWLDGTYPMSCAGYLGRLYHQESLPRNDGLYWIQPPGAEGPVKVYCQMTKRGGGWSLALKIDGRDEKWSFENEIWTHCDAEASTRLSRFFCTTPALGPGGRGRLKRDLVLPDAQAARLIAYDVLPFGSVLLQMMPFDPIDPTKLSGAFPPSTEHLLWQRGASLRAALLDCSGASGAVAPFNAQGGFLASSSERQSWESSVSLASGEIPYLRALCNRQGFCVKRDGGGKAQAIEAVRIGLLAGASTCDQPDGFVGIGPKFEADYKGDKAYAGNAGPDVSGVLAYKRHARMAFVSVREVFGTESGTRQGFQYVGADLSTIKDPTKDADGGYVRADGTIEASCLAYRNTSFYDPNTPPKTGFYWIHPSSVHKPIAKAFRVHCEMDYDGGGWTLIMKVGHNQGGAASRFGYYATNPGWTDLITLNEEDIKILPDKEAKLQSYHAVAYTHLLIGMHPYDQPISEPALGQVDAQLKRVILSKPMASMYEMISSTLGGVEVGGTSVSFDEWAGRDAWRAMLPDASLQRNCAREAYNVLAGGGLAGGVVGWARIAWLGNEQFDCGSVDSAIFLGGSADANFVVGNFASTAGSAAPDNGDKKIKGFAYLWVR